MDFTIELSAEEQAHGNWGADKHSLAVQLLMCNGFVILRGALPLDLVAAMKAQFDLIVEDCLASAPGKEGQDIPWMSNARTPFWIKNARLRAFIRMRDVFADPRLLANPFALKMMDSVLGPGFYCNSLSSDVCMAGALLQPPHRDIAFTHPPRTQGTLMNVPLMHCGDHNGPLEIWPGGTHLWSHQAFEQAQVGAFNQNSPNPAMEAFAGRLPSVRIELFPGDILLRDPGTLHRGTAYAAGEPRVMITAGYFRAGVRYGFGNPSYNLDRASFDQLPPSVRRLIENRNAAPAG